MYEKYNGTSRLVNVLDRADTRLLARVLHYEESQLEEDIQALKDVFSDVQEARKEEE